MKVVLLGRLRAEEGILDQLKDISGAIEEYYDGTVTDGQLIALTAIRTCYQHLPPTEIIQAEYERYFRRKATDGKKGTEADRLSRHIDQSGHTSTLEHSMYVFAVEEVSRTLLAQLTRHRIGMGYSVQSQRYVKFESGSRSGGATFYTPHTILKNVHAFEKYVETMHKIQDAYDELRAFGIPAEDARYLLPNGAHCNLVWSGNLVALLHFYSRRNDKTHAQAEIQDLAEWMRDIVVEKEPWTESLFNALKGE